MSGWYNIGKEGLLARTIPEEAGVYALGVNEDYTYDPTHVSFDELTPYILLPEQELLGVSFTDGILRANSPSWSAAGAGVIDRSLVLTGFVIYFKLDDTGALLAYIDSATVGLPKTLTGANVSVRFASNGILKL